MDKDTKQPVKKETKKDWKKDPTRCPDCGRYVGSRAVICICETENWSLN